MAAAKIMRVAEDDRPRTTKNVYVYKQGDRYFSGVRIPVNQRRYRTVDALLDDLTAKIPGLQRGARNLATSRGKHCIKSLSQLEHLGSYVCSDRQPSVKVTDWQKMINKPADFQFRGTFRVPARNASKENSKATFTSIAGTSSAPSAAPTTTRTIKRTQSLPARKVASESNQISEPTKRKKSKKRKVKKSGAAKYETSDSNALRLLDSGIDSAHTTLSEFDGVTPTSDETVLSRLALTASNEEESVSDRPPSRAQSEPGRQKRKKSKKRKTSDKTLLPLNKNKLKHVQRSNASIKKTAWSPDELPELEAKSNQLVKKTITSDSPSENNTSYRSPAFEFAVLKGIEQQTKDDEETNDSQVDQIKRDSATKIQRFYRDYSTKKYGRKSSLQSEAPEDTNEYVENKKLQEEIGDNDKEIDENTEIKVLNDKNELEEAEDKTKEAEDAPREVEDTTGEIENATREADDTTREAEDETGKEKDAEEEAEEARRQREEEDARHAKDFADTSSNHEAAIKIQTAFRNRLAQKEAETRTSLRTVDVTPEKPEAVLAERPLSSYRPETGDSSSTFWPSSTTPQPSQVNI